MAHLLVVRPGRSRAAAPGPGTGRQGVLLQEDPGLPAPTRDQGHHSRARQPEGGPSPARQQRGRPPAFDAALYTNRNVVERAINKLRATRAVATRYDKRDFVYKGTVDVASIRIWLRDPVKTHSRDTP